MNPYGFDWGPLSVERVAHVEGRGYVVDVRSRERYEDGVQIYVSEKGRSIRVFPRGRARLSGAEREEPS